MQKNNAAPGTSGWLEFLASTRLAVYTLIALALACTAGVLIPQKWVTLQPDEYMHLLASPLWRLLDRFGFLNVFTSVWFLMLVGLMLVNLILCTYLGLKRLFVRLERESAPLTAKSAKTKLFHRKWRAGKNSETTIREKLAALGRVQGPLKDDKGNTSFSVTRGMMSNFAPYVVHLSILVLVIGVMVDQLMGMEGQMNIVEGQTADIFSTFAGPDGHNDQYQLPFQTRCDDFDIEFYPGGRQPKDFKSKLTVIAGGKEVLHKTIEVNSPLNYGGFRFFQSSYGQTDSSVEISVERRSDGEKVTQIAAPMQMMTIPQFAQGGPESAPLKGYGIVDMSPNLQGNGPAVRIQVLKGNQQSEPFWVFLQQPDFDLKRQGDYTFRLHGLKSLYYTGLMVVRKPGAIGIWIGSALFMIAIMVGFFVPYRRAWTLIADGKLILAGTATRSKEPWLDRLEQVADEISKSHGKPEERSDR